MGRKFTASDNSLNDAHNQNIDRNQKGNDSASSQNQGGNSTSTSDDPRFQ